MRKEEIMEKMKSLNLPPGSFVVFGSCPMAVAGIREAKDIDLLVTPDLISHLEEMGWQKIYKGPGDEPRAYDIFEAHDNWSFSPYSPTLEHLLSNAQVVEGIPFASLEEVRKWKVASGGPKNMEDVWLIEAFLEKSI